jgi:hypothetical protein
MTDQLDTRMYRAVLDRTNVTVRLYTGQEINCCLAISLRTARFNIKHSTLWLLGFECYIHISEQTATFVLNIINWLVFITVVESVYSAVRTDSLYKEIT